MDLSESSEDHSNYHSSSLTSDWQFTHQIDTSSIVKPMNLLPIVWNQSIVRPPSILSNFPTDSGFIERAARFSCFNPFAAANEPLSAYPSASESPMNNDQTQRDSGEAEVSGDGHENSCSRDNGAMKRKRNKQEMEFDITKEYLQKGEQKSTSTKTSGKNGKDGADGAKEDYIHVRARRGQATNSHSLAERVRREKISERMKFLQDLVPGCSKVTGKAVMLDEIINYVQSLQRQVEFLSMKIAAVNPRLDFNIEELLSKDGGSSAVGNFLPEMIRPQLEQGLFQAGIPGMGNTSDALRRAINAQLTSMNGFKEHLPQMPNVWEEELHNVVHMNFAANPPFNTQEPNTKPCDGFPLQIVVPRYK